MNEVDFEALVPPWLRTLSLVAALLTVPSVLLDVVIGLPHWLDVFARVLNWTVWSVFLIVLIVVLVRAPSPWKALKANPVLPIIVVFTTPFAPAGLQMFRLLRLGALLGAAHHAKRLFSTQGLVYAGAVLAIVVVGGGIIFTAVERSAQHLSIESGIWWAIVTVTTVGYGDIVPHTEAGRAVAVIVMVTGIGTAALLVGAASQRFVAGSTGDDGAQEGGQPSLAVLHGEIRDLRAELAALREDLGVSRQET
ncbi:potassium channel family protein [Capillimicrobium parvum]|uniref:potassium channel family protein n=1 Tax=Capillimicrobium parvum TaxID=2884022 RepID=UPI00216B0511|nr:potassium channel family protein [Capillimicrobium parvum]